MINTSLQAVLNQRVEFTIRVLKQEIPNCIHNSTYKLNKMWTFQYFLKNIKCLWNENANNVCIECLQAKINIKNFFSFHEKKSISHLILTLLQSIISIWFWFGDEGVRLSNLCYTRTVCTVTQDILFEMISIVNDDENF